MVRYGFHITISIQASDAYIMKTRTGGRAVDRSIAEYNVQYMDFRRVLIYNICYAMFVKRFIIVCKTLILRGLEFNSFFSFCKILILFKTHFNYRKII